MAEGTNVGKIFLELEIQNKIDKQLSDITNTVKTVTEKASFATESTIGKAVSDINEKLNSIGKVDMSGVADKAKETMGKAVSIVKQESDHIDALIEASFSRRAKSSYNAGYSAVEYKPFVSAQSAIAEKMKETSNVIEQTAQKATKIPKAFRAAESPVELLEQKLGNINTQIGEQEAKMDSLVRKYAEVAAEKGMGSVDATSIDTQITSVQAKLINLQQTAMQTEQKLSKALSVSSGENFSEIYQSANTSFAGASQVAEISATKVKSAISGAVSAAKAGASMAASAASKSFATIRNVGTLAATKIRQSFAAAGSSISKRFTKLTQNMRRAFKAVFITSALYAGFRAIKEAISMVAAQNDQFSKSLNTIKGNLSVAFTPIINAVLPILTRFMSAVATATQYVATFVSGIFGKTYAQSLAATKQLKTVQKEAKKTRNLAGFDKINTLGGDSGGAAADAGAGAIDYGALVPDVDIQSKVDGLIAKIKNLDLAALGTTIGEKINTAIHKITDFINWDNVGAKITDGVSKITGFINKFTDATDWQAVGNTAAQGINTITNTISEFINNVDWGAQGDAFSTTINGMFGNVDWSKVGQTIADGINAAFNFLLSVVTTFDWAGFGQSMGTLFSDTITGIDWVTVGKTLSDGVLGLISTLSNFIKTADWSEIGNSIATFISNIDWAQLGHDVITFIVDALIAYYELIIPVGKALIDRLIDGIAGALVGLWDALNNVCNRLVNIVKEFFGIHSPSTVFADFGKMMMLGLANGITGAITKVKQACGTILGKIKEIFASVPNWFKTTFTKAWQNVKDVFSKGGKIFKGITTSIADTFKSIVNHIIDGINTVISKPFEGINDALGKLRDVSILGAKPFDFLPTISIPEIPKLATGGIITAPTLAMVGDNPRASSDPEVVAPLSKLKGMIGGGASEIDRQILDILLKIYKLISASKSQGGDFRQFAEMLDSYYAGMRRRTNGGV